MATWFDLNTLNEGSAAVFPAHRAAAMGDLDSLTGVIREDPTLLEMCDHHRATPLVCAVRAEQLDIVKLLVKMGADVHSEDSAGRSPLNNAAYQGWYEGVVYLLRNGGRTSAGDKCGRTPLHAATYPTDTRVISALLQTMTPAEVNIQDTEGMCALHWAAFHQRPQHVALLLSAGADPQECPDIDGRTPLHWAAQNGCVESCERLVGVVGPGGLDAEDHAGKAPIHFAAAAGHAEIVQLLANHGADVNAEDQDERSPLHWAAASGQTAAVQALLDQRADAGATDLEGATPLDYARHAGHTECVALLEAHLGLQSANPASPPAPQPSTGTPSHTKRNPLGFIVDFFRPKHRATSLPRQASSSSQEVATSCTTPRLDTKRHTPEQSRSPMRSPPLTPIKRQKEDEVLLSMEKIHISREDNPLLAKLRSSSQESAGRSPSSTEAGSEENLSHSFIIRSPPPVIKREHSLSPTMARFDTPSSGRARAERDAAEILALQRVLSDPGVTRPDPALPLPPPPGGSHSQLETSRHLPSAVVAEFPPTATRGRQLAPLRGSLPPQHGLHSKGLPSLSSHRALDSGEPLISPAGSTGFQAQSTHAPAALTPTSLAKKKRQRSLEERKFLS